MCLSYSNYYHTSCCLEQSKENVADRLGWEITGKSTITLSIGINLESVVRLSHCIQMRSKYNINTTIVATAKLHHRKFLKPLRLSKCFNTSSSKSLQFPLFSVYLALILIYPGCKLIIMLRKLQQQLIQMIACLKLQQIFKHDKDFAWRLLDAECQVYIKGNTSIEDIGRISQLYMIAVEKLNSLQDQRQKYFSHKMQKLMSEPFVIRCFNQKTDQKRNQMEFKRKEIQKKVSHESEKASFERLQHMVIQHSEKQKKILQKIQKLQKSQDQSLQERLKRRANTRMSIVQRSQLSQVWSNDSKGADEIQIWKKNAQVFNPESSTTTSSSFIQRNLS